MPIRELPILKVGDVVWLLEQPESRWMIVWEIAPDAVRLAPIGASLECSWYHRGQVLTAEEVGEILGKAGDPLSKDAHDFRASDGTLGFMDP